MSDNETRFVSEAAFEFSIEKMMQVIKKLILVIVILAVALIGTNVAWIIYESQYETVVCDIKSDDGNANFIGNDGDIVNGESDNSKEENQG